MNTHILRIAAILGSSFAALLQAAQPEPLFLWDFNNNSGVSTNNHGTAKESAITMVSADSVNTGYFSDNKEGRTGQSGDYAFDLTSATGMGSTTPTSKGPVGTVWSSAQGLKSLSELTSFTLVGWIKPAEVLANSGRIISSNTLSLMAGNQNQLVLEVNGDKKVYSNSVYTSVNQWMFFAVTFDASASTDNVTFYIGTDSSGSISKAGSGTLDVTELKTFSGQLLLGNNGDKNRPFHGMMDDIAIYGSSKDGSGALSNAQLNLLFNPSGVPEPSTWALLVGGAVFALVFVRRRIQK